MLFHKQIFIIVLYNFFLAFIYIGILEQNRLLLLDCFVSIIGYYAIALEYRTNNCLIQIYRLK